MAEEAKNFIEIFTVLSIFRSYLSNKLHSRSSSMIYTKEKAPIFIGALPSA
jgi:hypothetical protein